MYKHDKIKVFSTPSSADENWTNLLIKLWNG